MGLSQLKDTPVLGITDYFSIDGYKKVKEYKDGGGLQHIDLLLPNVEFRIVPVAAAERAINIHFVFSPNIVAELEGKLFQSLEFIYNGEKFKCTKDGLIGLGRKYKGDLSLHENTAYREGAEQFKINFEDLRKILDEDSLLNKNTLVFVANKSGDGNSGLQDSGLKALRQEILRMSHGVFSSSPQSINYFLGKATDAPDEVIRQYGSLKPCLHGSDAHDLDSIGRIGNNRYTWIKADTSFEGLRQICYEPKYRVHIGEHASLAPLYKLSRVSFDFPNDIQIGGEKFCFSGKHVINFSPYLTCLIGGRGSGKSIALNLIHEKLNPGENEFSKQLN